MRAYARKAVVCEAAEAAIFYAGDLERAAAEGVNMLASHAGNHLRPDWGIAVCAWYAEFWIVVSDGWECDTAEGSALGC